MRGQYLTFRAPLPGKVTRHYARMHWAETVTRAGLQCAGVGEPAGAHVRRLRSPGMESSDPGFRCHREVCL